MNPDIMFKSAAGMSQEIKNMEKTEAKRRKNRALVSNFYNGAPPYTDEEAARVGLQVNVNNLFGYTSLAEATSGLMAIYNKPPLFLEVKLENAPVGEKERWEMAATAAMNRIIKRSDRFKLCYQGIAGDCVLHGEGIPLMHTTTDWCPKHFDLSCRLVPDDALASSQLLTHFAMAGGIGFDDALFHLRRKSHGWNTEALKKICIKLTEGSAGEEAQGFNRGEASNPEQEEYLRQAGANVSRLNRAPVHYFYQVRFDKPGTPVDLTIIAQAGAMEADYAGKDDAEGRVLYRGECRYPAMSKILSAVFMGCRLGGTSLWHRNLGLGHLNYDISWHIETLMCRMMQAVQEDGTMFWQVNDSSVREALESIRLKHNGIIPEGVTPVPNRHQSNIQGLLSAIQALRQQGAQNAMGLSHNTGGQADMLEVQALWQRDQAMSSRSEHSANWFEQWSRNGAEMFARFVNPFITSDDKGYSEIKDFQAAMERQQIPLRYLQPENVTVSIARIAGDGNQQQAAAQGLFILNNMQHIDPTAQSTAKRHAFAAILGDYDLAARFIAVDSEVPGTQRREAEQEEAAMFKRADCGQMEPLPTTAGDVHEQHIPVHFETMSALVAKGVKQKNEWTEEQVSAFQLIGAHTYLHIRTLEESGKGEIAKHAMDALNRLSAMGQKMANNLAQKKGSEEIDPIAAAKLQIESGKLDLQRKKADFQEGKFERTQGVRERQVATSELTSLQRDSRESEAHRQELAMNDIETARALRE